MAYILQSLRLVHQGGRKEKLGIIAVTTMSSYTNTTST